MFIPGSYGAALLLLLGGMVCWGSWANTYKLTPNRRFELFYIDFSFGILLTAVVAAVTLGSLFGGPTALENLRFASGTSQWYAVAAGVVDNIGNVLLTAALVMVGMAVAFPFALGLSIVVSTILSYLITPKGDPVFLFTGVGFVLAAVIFGSLAHRAREAHSTKPSLKGIIISFFAGVFICGFGPLVAKSFASPAPVGPYGITFLFSVGIFVSTFPLIGYLMRRPVEGETIAASEYWRGTFKEHSVGIIGGVVWCIGTLLTFLGADHVGMALAGAIGQANSLVAAVWGVFVWREFRGASMRARVLLIAMFALYIVGITLVALSY